MQLLDQLIYFGCHHDEHLGARRVDGRECMRGSGGDRHEIALLENTPRTADEYLKATIEYAERLIGSVVHMEWRLITWVRFQVPSPDHEVAHADNVALMAEDSGGQTQAMALINAQLAEDVPASQGKLSREVHRG